MTFSSGESSGPADLALASSANRGRLARWCGDLGQDIAYAVRIFGRHPTSHLASLVILSVGLGANLAMLGLANALILRSLPVTRPNELVHFVDGPNDEFTFREYGNIKAHSLLLSGVFAASKQFHSTEIQEGGRPVTAVVQTVSADYFSLLGVKAAKGRLFESSDRALTNLDVAVISDRLWRAHFQGRADVLGSRFAYGRDYTIVGITPPGFYGTAVDLPVDVWVPLEPTIREGEPLWTRVRWLQVFGRRRANMVGAGLSAEASALLGRRIVAEDGSSGSSALRSRYSRSVLLLTLLSGLIFLLACFNLANLLLVRLEWRRTELALRVSLGATSRRVVRQLVTENTVLLIGGIACGLVIAYWLNASILRFLPPSASVARGNLSFHVEAGPIALAGGVAFLALGAVTVGAAVRLGRSSPSDRLRSTSLSVANRWTQGVLVVGQIALCAVLLTTTALLATSLWKLKTLDSGFDARNLLVAHLNMPWPELSRRLRFQEDFRRVLGTLPGVRAASYSQVEMLSGNSLEADVLLGNSQGTVASSLWQRVAPEFFAAMGTPLLTGRDFAERDDAESEQVAIVNQSFVRRFMAGRVVLGGRFRIVQDVGQPLKTQEVKVIGIVRDSNWVSLRESPQPTYYRPFSQEPASLAQFVVRSVNNNVDLPARLRTALALTCPECTVAKLEAFTDVVDGVLSTERLVTFVSTSFGLMALLIAWAGLYSVLAYQVAQRTREIGLRIALGAQPGRVIGSILSQGVLLAVVGTVIGSIAAATVTSYFQKLLFGVTPLDPWVFGVVALGLILIAAGAAFLPARRASALDPAVALRHY